MGVLVQTPGEEPLPNCTKGLRVHVHGGLVIYTTGQDVSAAQGLAPDATQAAMQAGSPRREQCDRCLFFLIAGHMAEWGKVPS